MNESGSKSIPAATIDARDADDQPFDPTDLEDARRQVMSAIKERRGQAGFRHNLIAAYGDTDGDSEMLARAAAPGYRVFAGKP